LTGRGPGGIIGRFCAGAVVPVSGVSLLTPIADEKSVGRAAAAERTLGQIIDTVQWLLIALILALYFRAFIIEAYRIPTGSMANALKGAHFRLVCPRCGWRFDHGFESSDYGLAVDTLPQSGKEMPRDCRCPNCGFNLRFARPVWITNGDRILVLKCEYQFVEPKRWDVVVFKDPLNPRSNMIKRLVGRPGETVRIIDGDIYIDGAIAAKPKKLQDRLWIPVYDNDYEPVKPNDKSFNRRAWHEPWKSLDAGGWAADANNPTCFELDSGDKVEELVYEDLSGEGLKAEYAYNGSDFENRAPWCSDLKVRFFARSQGSMFVGAQLSKYGQVYRGWVEDGRMRIGKAGKSGVEVLVERPLKAKVLESTMLAFANVDHVLLLEFGQDSVRYNLGPGPDDAGQRLVDIEPMVSIFAKGKVGISHLAIFRDIYYTSRHWYGGDEVARAAGEEGFKLNADEFFVLGDNSPNSHDGRWWDGFGIGNNGTAYRAGIVPRDYLVGKAIYVYWPGGFRPSENIRSAMIPNFGQMRFIYGGQSRGR
jgi:signal peptidase I